MAVCNGTLGLGLRVFGLRVGVRHRVRVRVTNAVACQAWHVMAMYNGILAGHS